MPHYSSARSLPASAPWRLVRPGPVIATICQYGTGLKPAAHGASAPARRIVLRGMAAAGLAAVLDSGSPLVPAGRRCATTGAVGPFSQSVTFGYRSGRSSRAAVFFSGCSLAIATAGDRTAVFGLAEDADLFAYSSVSSGGTGPRTPALVGLTASAAAARAEAAGFSVTFDGSAPDQSVSIGTVLFQSLPAGARDAGPGEQVGVIISVVPSPACSPRQLALSYLGGQASAGSDFGTLLVRDVSARACTLTGPLMLTGLNAVGQPVTRTLRYPVSGTAVLSPDAGPVAAKAGSPGARTGVAPGELTGIISLSAEYRDGPASVDNGFCEPLWKAPASWRVELRGGPAITVANADPADPGLVPSGGLVTCRGQLNAPQPATIGWPGI